MSRLKFPEHVLLTISDFRIRELKNTDVFTFYDKIVQFLN